MHDTWFADEERVRKAVGLLEKPIVQHPNAREVRYGLWGFNTMKHIHFFCLKSHSIRHKANTDKLQLSDTFIRHPVKS